MKYNLPKKYLSSSQIGMYLDCPKQYEYRYVNDIIIPPGKALVQGSSLHVVNEDYYNSIIANTTPMTHSEAIDLAMMTFRSINKEEECKFSVKDDDETATFMKNAVPSYIDNIAPTVTPVSTEEEIWYNSDCGVDIKGYVDLKRKPYDWEDVTQDFVICDYKLTGNKWTINKLSNSLQFMIYSLATGCNMIEIHNVTKSVKKAKVNKLTKTAATEPVVDPASNLRLLRYDFDGSEYDHVESIIENVAKGISAGYFPPCNPDHWRCSETWCGYFGMCRGAGRKSNRRAA